MLYDITMKILGLHVSFMCYGVYGNGEILNFGYVSGGLGHESPGMGALINPLSVPFFQKSITTQYHTCSGILLQI